ncbi:protein of unknown function [Sphingobacterium nematocida]|uniref:eCIS core domain-containing protein n=1 Tax=Sphingobacterium nematocida TaxID=1513896 RepID=A0A1T5EG59_9SPHI|nr:DUF4157 domain-containing protein [Sphingobacterium nematocida]SKB82758.1 protein of unknown function [Sphingobacterium nematocida]
MKTFVEKPKNTISETGHVVERNKNARHDFVDQRDEARAIGAIQRIADESPRTEEFAGQKQMVQQSNNTGLPDKLKSGIESLSGYAMDDIKVHYNSAKPAQLQAHAYAQGTDIHIAPGQEQYLPHEAWHVVQQKQGRVRATMQLKGNVQINDDAGLESEADIMGMKALGWGRVPVEGHNLIAQSVTGQEKPVQRAGVKSELDEANSKFEDFKENTEVISELREDYSVGLYNAYKPSQDDQQHYLDKANRNKANGYVKESLARKKALRLNHWTDTAIVSAERIYLELEAAMNQAEEDGLGYESITMGMDTDIEPDVYLDKHTALEVKHVDSASVGAVDEHIRKGSSQLKKRTNNTVENTIINKWVLHVKINNPENPWPYTPVKLDKLVKGGKVTSALTEQTAIDRIAKYEKGSTSIPYQYCVESVNPNVGSIYVSV